MIRDLTRESILSRKPYNATKLWDRTRGMIGRDFSRCAFDSMVFPRCNAIHTFFMSCALDVIFLDRENTIVHLVEHLKPWHPCVRKSGACSVIELPPGAIAEAQAALGDRIELSFLQEGNPETGTNSR